MRLSLKGKSIKNWNKIHIYRMNKESNKRIRNKKNKRELKRVKQKE